ncbi:MAG: cysteine desulfurase [Chloroflexi bacterium]|nr:cysteine desulfurase [Chloroflexota bacterium]
MPSPGPIYLDYAATTPLDPRVREAMLPYFSEEFGNPSSVHGYGRRAEAALEDARQRMAELLNAQPEEIIFTSGGTESDNLALRGAALAARQQRGAIHLLISPVEHDAVAKTAAQLADHLGFTLEKLPVDEFGMVNPDEVAKRLDPEPALLSVILGNNEIGTVNPMSEIAAICRERGVPLHSDAVQSGAYLPLDVQKLGVDLLSIGAHKFYGPKGVGALYVRAGTPLLPTQTGGGHESGRRAGTPNVAYILGMVKAFELAQSELDRRVSRLGEMRNKIMNRILVDIPDSQLTGHPEIRLANHASFVFKGVDGNALLMLLDDAGFACSSGSACKTGDPEPSQVLLALGLSPEWALGSLRVTLGVDTTGEQINSFLAALPALVEKARALEAA